MVITEWKALAGRIDGFVSASNLFFCSFNANDTDWHGVSNNFLIPRAKEIYEDIYQWWQRNRKMLTPEMDKLVTQFHARFPSTRLNGIPGIQAASTYFCSFKSELDFELRDIEMAARGIVERAFCHLNRSIVANSTIGTVWQKAFHDGEIACEKLGGAHLLSHGLWGFKVAGPGERTDLVLHEPVKLDDVQATQTVLVLTEWKLVRNPTDAVGTFEDAVVQAERYGQGILSGIELGLRRFIVLVSNEHLTLPQKKVKDTIEYQAINVVVSPKVPSRS